jgi:hypothetical protein
MTRAELIANLKYIAASPPRAYGGFHPQTVAVAKAALRALARKRAGK